mgnify:CR=1 FL=1
MKKILFLFTLTLSCIFAAPLQETGINTSVAHESSVSLNNASKYLLSTQHKNGSWGPWGGHPAYTSLIATSLAISPQAKEPKTQAAIQKGIKYILTFAQADGSIWQPHEKQYPNYTTSVSMIALYVIDGKKHADIILKARRFLKKSQFGADAGIEEGGIGYGSQKNKSDLSNTQYALEALYVTADVEKEKGTEEDIKATKKTWKKALKFLNRCQVNSETNDLKWAEEAEKADKSEKGGFIYSPDRTKAKGETLRSYGSMTYAGLKSMVYAQLKKDDPRVVSAIAWAGRNYTLENNPGVGLQGHYYYIHTFAKALDAYGQNTITDKDGNKRFWRRDVVEKLINMQKPNGSWKNKVGRWQENQPELCTAYAMASMLFALSQDRDKL